MDAILTAAAAVSKKRRLDPTLQKVDELLDLLEGWRARHASSPGLDISALHETLSKLDARGTVQGHHRELVSAATKLGKAADKVIGPSLENAIPHLGFDPALVNAAIHQHLLVAGRFDVAECFGRELELAVCPEQISALREMHAVRRSLEEGDSGPINQWTLWHVRRLRQRGSALPFEVTLFRFSQLLHAGDTPAALRLLRGYVDELTSVTSGTCGGGGGSGGSGGGAQSSVDPRVSRMMGALAYAQRIDNSPYADMLDEQVLRARLSRLFTRECLAVLELPRGAPLAACVDAGMIALPKLAKLASVLKAKYVTICEEGSTLPLELELGPRFTSHSTFTCPISKEAATPSNPPVLLPCGHVLALGSATKLARGSRSAHFKCPYCPAEGTIATAQVLTL